VVEADDWWRLLEAGDVWRLGYLAKK